MQPEQQKKEKKKGNWRIAIILILLTAGVIATWEMGKNTYQDYITELKENSYQKGFNDTILSVAREQGNTGNIILVVNNSLEWINIRQLCGVE